jgi:hypothetical protein
VNHRAVLLEGMLEENIQLCSELIITKAIITATIEVKKRRKKNQQFNSCGVLMLKIRIKPKPGRHILGGSR